MRSQCRVYVHPVLLNALGGCIFRPKSFLLYERINQETHMNQIEKLESLTYKHHIHVLNFKTELGKLLMSPLK